MRFDRIAEELLKECQSPLYSDGNILAATPSHTLRVIQVAMEISYSAGTKGATLAEPKELREVVANLIKETYGLPR